MVRRRGIAAGVRWGDGPLEYNCPSESLGAVPSMSNEPRKLERARAPAAKKQIGQHPNQPPAANRDDTLSPAAGCLWLHDSFPVPTQPSAEALIGEAAAPVSPILFLLPA